MKRSKLAGLLVFLASTLAPALLTSQNVNVTTWHNDNARTGQNSQETILSTRNVNSKSFGKLFSDPIVGQAYAQPLYVPGVQIPGRGTHNVVYVATEHDQVYAFDADTVGQPLWQVSFIDLSKGITTVSTQGSRCGAISPEIGITATPALDAASGTLYVTAETDEKGTIVQHLHALDTATGAEKFNGPVVIQGSVNGLDFDPTLIQRTALLLLNGNVYFAYASLCDPHPYHGWLFGYNAQNLRQPPAVFSTTPSAAKGGIWQAGGGLASDGTDIFFMVANGYFDANQGGANYGQSMVRMRAQGGILSVADYFTPLDWAAKSKADLDLGSGGTLLLPQQSGQHPEEMLGEDKSGRIWVVDRQHMGKFHAKKNDVVQQIQGPPGGFWSSPAYWQQHIYYAGVNSHLSMYSITNGRLSPKPVSKSLRTFFYPGCTPSVSSNGASNGIVWVLQLSASRSPAVLRAYDATNLAKELYDSDQAAKGRDKPGPATKFSVPIIVNGKVYIATQTDLDAYGLLNTD
jgi:outer membrane protein assembly factor BamB